MLVCHQCTQNSKKPYTCGYCGQCFSESSMLLCHRCSHQGAQLHICTTCVKDFGQRSDVVVHQCSHTAKRPFPCLECSCCFSDHLDLTKHQHMHMGKKPYAVSCVPGTSRAFPTSLCSCATTPATGSTSPPNVFNVGSKRPLHQKRHLGEQLAQCAKWLVLQPQPLTVTAPVGPHMCLHCCCLPPPKAPQPPPSSFLGK